MNCAQARFLLYAYLDREMTRSEETLLERHVAACSSCAMRARSARGLARVLRCRLDRAPAPDRLRLRIHNDAHSPAPSRAAVAGLAAAVLLLIVPLVADGVPRRRSEAVPPALSGEAGLVTKHLTGMLVCLHCESRREAGLCDTHSAERVQEAAFCADDGELWRLVPPPNGFSAQSLGQTMTVDGVAFPQSGFLRASRAGY